MKAIDSFAFEVYYNYRNYALKVGEPFMSEEIVICDNSSYYGRLFSRYLEKKADIKYCRQKDYPRLINEIKSSPPDTVIIFSGSISDKEYLLISGIKKTSEQSRIIVCTNVTGGKSAELLVNMSVDYIIGMPIGIQELHRLISGILDFDSEYRLESEIEFFLKFKGFTVKNAGFNYLRTGILLCLTDYTLLDSLNSRLYPLIAEKNSTTSSGVEMTLRRTAAEKGLTNYELLCSLTDSFASRYKLFRR